MESTPYYEKKMQILLYSISYLYFNISVTEENIEKKMYLYDNSSFFINFIPSV